MIITCDNCNTRYKISENALKSNTKRARCAKCQHVFSIFKDFSTGPVNDSVNSAFKDISIDGIDKNDAGKDAKVISICNQKGGVAKTTTALNLAVSLADQGKRVLLIDFDIQANLTLLMGYKDEKSFFEVIENSGEKVGISEFIKKTSQGVWLLPSNSKMALLSKKHLQSQKFEYLLRDRISGIKPYFDLIIIDTPPSGDFYTLNALLASSLAIIPTPCEYLSMQGVNHIVDMIRVIKNKSSHDIDFQVVITKYDQSNTAEKVVMNKLLEEFDQHILSTRIDKDSKIMESQIVHIPTLHYDRESVSGQQYSSLARELYNIPGIA